MVRNAGSSPAAGFAATRPQTIVSETAQPPAEKDDTDEDAEDLYARLDELEGWQSYIKDHVIPRVDELETTVEQRDERIQQLEARVQDLERQLQTLDGLADDEATTPQKRAVDLARAMIRQANTRPDGRIAKYYKEVKEDLATLGHDDLYDQQAFNAMEDVADVSGFGLTTVTRNGQQVKAVGLNLAELATNDPVNEINNETGADTTDNTTEPVTQTTP